MKDPASRNPIRIVVESVAETLAATLGPDEVRAWIVPLDSTLPASAREYQSLSDEERRRAERYQVAKARTQFVTVRGLLRRILGEYLGLAPNDVPIEYNGAGKPHLPEGMRDIHFNVSHTDGLALVAVARRPIGVDVERLRIVANADGLVERFFSEAEKQSYQTLPFDLRHAGFFKGWTCKEAVIKGGGLNIACLDEFDVELHPHRPAELLSARNTVLRAATWRLTAWEPLGGFAAAIATTDG